MATRSKSKARPMGSSTASDGRSRGSASGGLKGRMRGAMRSAARSGVHVRAEMTDPKVARIIIEIDWEELVSRVAMKMGRGIEKRAVRRTGRARRASASAS